MTPFLSRIGAFIALVSLIAIGAQLSVPMHPVPMTLQSLFIILAGMWLGPVWGTISTLTYLTLALAGLPVLSGGASGLAPFTGATAGYLIGFPVVAGLAGLMRSRLEPRQGAAWCLGLFGLHMLLLVLGTAWLARYIDTSAAIASGFTPFLIGAGVKSVLAWLIWRGWARIRSGETG